jgi:hypothetical protein
MSKKDKSPVTGRQQHQRARAEEAPDLAASPWHPHPVAGPKVFKAIISLIEHADISTKASSELRVHALALRFCAACN